MNMLRRLEALEAVLLRVSGDMGYELILLEESESCDEGLLRSELETGNARPVLPIKFVNAGHKEVIVKNKT